MSENFQATTDNIASGLVLHTGHASQEISPLLADVDLVPKKPHQALKKDEPVAPLQKDLDLPKTAKAREDFAATRIFMTEAPKIDCDRRPQSPWLTGMRVADDCGIKLSVVYPQVKDAETQAIVKQPDGSTNWGAAFKYCDETKKKCVYITNDHVSQDSDQVGLVARDGKTLQYGRVLARDIVHDVDIVSVPAGDTRPSIKVGSLPKVDDPVFTLGHPYGLPGDVISAGHVQQLNYTITDADSLQTYNGLTLSDIVATPGNSGGPEFNARGEVIGIKSNAGPNGTSMSIPIKTAIDLIP